MMRGGPGGRPGGPGGGGPGMMGFAMNAAVKPKNFGASLRRLVRTLRPERRLIALVLVLGVVSVVFAVIGPKLLGNATNILFDGVLGKQIPAGVTKDQAVDGLRARGQDRLADMLASTNVVPGHGVDFGALGAAVMLLVVLYVLSALFSWGQSYLMAVVDESERTAAAGVTGVARTTGAALAPVLAVPVIASSLHWLPFVAAGALKIVYDLLLLWNSRPSLSSDALRAKAAENSQS